MSGRSSVEALQGASHIAANSHTFRDASVFRIVVAGIRDLQPVNRSLNRRNLCGEAGSKPVAHVEGVNLYIDYVFLLEGLD